LLLFILKLAIYSKSSVLPMIVLSLFGLVHGVANVPKNRINAVKTLLHYGIKVFKNGLGTTIQTT
jgi:hypothetical protein